MLKIGNKPHIVGNLEGKPKNTELTAKTL